MTTDRRAGGVVIASYTVEFREAARDTDVVFGDGSLIQLASKIPVASKRKEWRKKLIIVFDIALCSDTAEESNLSGIQA